MGEVGDVLSGKEFSVEMLERVEVLNVVEGLLRRRKGIVGRR